MKATKPTSAEEYKLQTSFEQIRKVLLQQARSEQLEKPLAYWALPSDRRLPLAFLGRSVRELVSASYQELCATPGVGQKKIRSLIKLLHRAAEPNTPATPYGIEDLADDDRRPDGPGSNGDFDPACVSESIWAQWRATVRRHGLGQLPLGRLAPSLRSVPTVIWETPLEAYLDQSLAEIRQRKTHGEKRVRVVLEVFHAVHRVLHAAPADTHVAVRLLPRFAADAERWIAEAVAQNPLPDRSRVAGELVEPLLAQIRHDGGDVLAQLLRARFGLDGPARSVRQLAAQLSVTRARIYQLLEDGQRIMHVRWPTGRCQAARLADAYRRAEEPSDGAALAEAVQDLLFPADYISG